MKAVKVETASDRKEFLEFPARLMKHDLSYIRPLDKDIESVFNPAQNKFFRSGECERFLFLNDRGETVGKIAVFVSKKYRQKQPTGGFGFFDCIDEQSTANFMLDFAKDWLQQRGMEAMDGPVNFGERDRFWGLLTKGFTPPLYGMNYHPPYYKQLLENYGMQVYFKQLCFSRKVHAGVAESFLSMHERISANAAIRAERLRKNTLEKYARDFSAVYNKAWASHAEGKQMSAAQALALFKSLRPVIDEHISWFVYHNDAPIAVWLNIPDLNQWFKTFNGKLGWWQKFRFLVKKKLQKNTKMVGLVFGIVPEWQRKGVDGYMIWEGTRHFRKTTAYTDYEMQWIGDFNPKMIRIAQNLETEVTRELTTYRILFNGEMVERHPEV